MLPYFIFFIVVVCLCFLEFISVKKRIIYILLYFLLVFFAGCRDNTGADWVEYEDIYRETPTIGQLVNGIADFTYLPIERGYLLVSVAFKSLHLNFNAFIFFITAFYVGIFFKHLPKYTSHILLAVLVYIYYNYYSGFSIIRQVIASSIFFYAIQFIKSEKLFKYLLSIIAATLFHYSAIILAPLYFVCNRRFATPVIFSILFLAILVERSHVLLYLSQTLINIFTSPLTQAITAKYIEYLTDAPVNIYSSIYFEWFFLIIACSYYRDRLRRHNEYFEIFFNILWIGLVVYTLFSAMGSMGRVILYFKFAYIVLVPAVIFLFRENAARYSFYCMVALLVGVRTYVGMIGDSNNTITYKNRYIPYKSVLN